MSNTLNKQAVEILNEDHIRAIGIDWNATAVVIEDAVRCLDAKDFAQPLKPYLRYREKKNRIIAMPAFVGGSINMAGIKWIASFPDNIKKGIPRAHSIIILNHAETGEPLAIICTTLLSIIRTASVSAMVLRYFDSTRTLNHVTVGIVGFGPIGQYHLQMCLALLGDRIANVFLYDIRPIDPSIMQSDSRIKIVNTWKEAYQNSDVFITCTVSDSPYIDELPKPGSLHLNVSLRDYKTVVHQWFGKSIIVDNWIEVCREKTDIEMLHLEKGLQEEDTRSITDVVVKRCLDEFDRETPIMFNPMGMAVFDIAIGTYYFNAQLCKNHRLIGSLEDAEASLKKNM